VTDETPEKPEALRVFARGRVQGVGFRAFVQWRGRDLGLTGFARNLSDGRTVEVVAQGPRVLLETLLLSLKQGPPMAHVERVDASWGDATGGYVGFTGR
jgi:acylphosphatase